jgi:tripeptide aminopeptidase
MERHGKRVAAVIAVDGNLGVINHVAITVRRQQITVETEGGHSWADAGKPSAIHALARIAARISELLVPREPRTVLNIGTISGGTSVNAIAQRAQLALDIRSTDALVVQHLEQSVNVIVDDARADDTRVDIAIIGDRPGGKIAADHPLVKAIVGGYASVGVKSVSLPGSTDANIPLSLGIPAASMGVAAGGRIHTLQEFLDPESLPVGADALLQAVVSLQESLRR